MLKIIFVMMGVLGAVGLLTPPLAVGQTDHGYQFQSAVTNVLWSPPVAVGQTNAPVPQAEGLRIFYCGHSFHTYVWAPVWDLAVADGRRPPIRWWPQFIGGSTTLQHWNLPDDKNMAKQLLTTGEVDVLSMAPRMFPDAGIDNYVKLGLAHNPNMRFTVQLSWGGYDRDNQTLTNLSEISPLTHVDREKTPAELEAFSAPNIKAGEEQIDRLNKEIGRKVVFLVPTAQAIVTLRTRIYNKQMPGLESQALLFNDSIGHPSPPLQTLNAYLHYAVIYRRSPVGLPVAGALKNVKNPAWDEKFNRSLQELAWETVTNYPYSGVTAATEVK